MEILEGESQPEHTDVIEWKGCTWDTDDGGYETP